MSHNTNPNTGHSGQYGIAPGPRDNHHYDQPGERLHFDTIHDDFDREMDDLRNTGQHSGQAGQYIPSAAEQGLIEVHAYGGIDAAIQDANNIDDAEDYLHEMEQGIAAFSGNAVPLPLPLPQPAAVAVAPPAVAAPPQGPLAGSRNDKRRARLRAAGYIGGLLFTGGIAAGATYLSMALTGWAKAATPEVDKMKDATDTGSTGGGGGNAVAKTYTPDQQTLKLWLAMTDAALFKIMRDQIIADTQGMNLDNVNYVVSYLSMIFDGIYPPDSNPAYKAALVPQATIDGDYSAMKTSGMTILKVFDKSAEYPDTDAVDAATVTKFGRGVRLAYLRAMYAKAVVETLKKPGT